MQHAIAYNLIHELRIAVGLQALHFRPGLNYLQWGTDVTDSAAGFVAPAAPAPAAPPAPATAAPAAAPGPATATPADIATAVAHAFPLLLEPHLRLRSL